jgi:opacity protein-like surface antigen
MKALRISIVAAALLTMGINSAKAQAFQDGKSYISVGYGYALFNASTFFGPYESFASFDHNGFGPLTLQYEYAVGPKFGIGIDLGYSGSSVAWDGDAPVFVDGIATGEIFDANYKYQNAKLTLNLRGNVHFGSNDKIDPYLGFGFGFKSSTWSLETNDDDFIDLSFSTTPISMLLRFGTRVMFTDNIGAFVEGGIGHGVFQGGIVAKL